MPSFSKTRICYWENNPSLITEETLDTKVEVVNLDNKDLADRYTICRVKGADHGWHSIPLDIWGLYVSDAEFMSLVENFESFTPTNISCTVAHSIPLAKYAGTTNTTQLSFNNTIFSLLYVLADTDNVTNSYLLNSDPETAYKWFRTFDGSGFADNKRLLLPKSDLFYKIPSGTSFADSQQYLITKDTTGTIDATKIDSLKEGYKTADDVNQFGDLPLIRNVIGLAELKEIFYPEFLQDNSNIKALYPGENQDIFEYSNENSTLSTIHSESVKFDQRHQTLDMRAYGMNSNTYADTKFLLFNRLFPRCRGPQVNKSTYGMNDGDINQYIVNDFGLEDATVKGPPKWFIKGVPILDPDDSIVPHHFLATVTWTLNVEGTAKPISIPRTLRYGHLYQDYVQYIKAITDQGMVEQSAIRYTKSWPKRPFQDSHYHPHIVMQRSRNQTRATPYVQEVIMPPYEGEPTIANRKTKTLDNEEHDFNNFKRTNRWHIPTKSFYRTNHPVATRRSKRLASKTKAPIVTVPSDDDFTMIE